RLLPLVGGGRIAEVAVMVSNPRIADLIRDARPEAVIEAIAEGSFHGMQTFAQALIELVLAGDVDRDVAADAATERHDFMVALEHATKRQAAGLDPRQSWAPPTQPEPEPIHGGLRVVRPSQ